MKKLLRFLRDEDGPTTVEYAVMVFLILIVCISAIGTVGQQASSSFTSSQDEITTHFNQAGVGN